MLEICTARSYDPNYIICTESGAPTKSTSSAPGSTALQQNYFTKMSVLAQVNGVSQVRKQQYYFFLNKKSTCRKHLQMFEG